MPATKEQYRQIYTLLHQLADVLREVGIKELNLKDGHDYYVFDSGRQVNKQLLDLLCKDIDEIHREAI
jgi:hypothetical protein